MFGLFGKQTDTSCDLSDAETNCSILVNLNSGGKSGSEICEVFRDLGVSVIPLQECCPSHPERQLRLSDLAAVIMNGGHVIIAGGDGTNIWACAVIQEACEKHDLDFPFISLYPLGSGNDLSRSVGWGNKEPSLSRASCVSMLHKFHKRLTEGSVSTLDRWGINWVFSDSEPNDCWGRSLPTEFLCYISIGYDARIAHEFEVDRQHQQNMNPEALTSADSNFMNYIYLGTSEFFVPCQPLTNEDVRLWIDGKQVDIPEGTRSLKLLNINSAANGVFFWGNSPSRPGELQDWEPPRFDDGLVEVVASPGLKSMIGFRYNYSHASRLGQTRHVVWELLREMPIQVDGEAWTQKPCRLEFFLRDQVPTIVGKTGVRGVHEEVLAIHQDPTCGFAQKRRECVAASRRKQINRDSPYIGEQDSLEIEAMKHVSPEKSCSHACIAVAGLEMGV